MKVIWKVKFIYWGRNNEEKEITYTVLTNNGYKDFYDAVKIAELEIQPTTAQYNVIGVEYCGKAYHA